MKLRNKKTGEIMDDAQYRNYSLHNGFGFRLGDKEYEYHTLAELNEEWEDYEEPKGWWYIDCNGEVFRGENADKEHTEEHKSIGNYYTSSKEAEKAVEKLKAWKRLNKCDFRFEGYTDRDRANGGDIVIYAHVNIPNNNLLEEAQPAMIEDLDLLFGGKE